MEATSDGSAREARDRNGPGEQLKAGIAAIRAVIADLEADLAAIGESTAQSPDDEHDAEGSTVAYERARVTALLAHAKRRLAGLEAAAGRAGGEGQDRCEGCGRPIPAERLMALPDSRLCVQCAALRPGLESGPSRLRGPTGVPLHAQPGDM